jgi:NAD kinase
VDGRESALVKRGAVVAIRKAKNKLRLASMLDMWFFTVVCRKLKWSGSNV